MTDSELLALGDANLAEATREFARGHPESEIVERDDLLLVAGGTPFPAGFFNCAMRLLPSADPPAGMLMETAKRFFRERKRGFTVYARGHWDADLDAACPGAGLPSIADTPGMAIDGPAPAAPAPPGIELRPLSDVETAMDFATVSSRAYQTMGLPPEATLQAFEKAERLLRPHVLGVVAYRDGVPLSCALSLLSHGIAGIYWVGTVPDGRGQGLGGLCTREVTNRSFRAGARATVLQASDQGDPIYRRMGYRELTRYRWYVQFTPP